MSHGLVPSKSTVYVSNLPFSLTNNDLHKIFEKYGKVVKVTVLKDKITRKSRGVAFVFFLNKEDAQKCSSNLNGQQMFGRTLKSSIAKDNGRSAEFIQKKQYPDKSQCYECGDEGHLSYNCPKNALGKREPPPKKERKRKKKADNQAADFSAFDSDDEDSWRTSKPSVTTCETDGEEEVEEPDLETLSAVIKMEQEKYSSSTSKDSVTIKRKRIKKDTYFSDEEELSE